MEKVLIVSHCFLNTAAKVERFHEDEIRTEEELRIRILEEVVKQKIQLIQLPCPEFVMYGASRWGHVREQFDNPFFRRRCRELLEPIVDQIKEYLSYPERYKVLGILGIDGSPSCGVKYTCRGNWGGELSGREIKEVIGTVCLADGKGVLMDEFRKILDEQEIVLPMDGLFAEEPERAFRLFR